MLALTARQRDGLSTPTRAAIDELERVAAAFPDVFDAVNHWVLAPGHSLETGAARALIEEFTRIARFDLAQNSVLLRQVNLHSALYRRGFMVDATGGAH